MTGWMPTHEIEEEKTMKPSRTLTILTLLAMVAFGNYAAAAEGIPDSKFSIDLDENDGSEQALDCRKGCITQITLKNANTADFDSAAAICEIKIEDFVPMTDRPTCDATKKTCTQNFVAIDDTRKTSVAKIQTKASAPSGSVCSVNNSVVLLVSNNPWSIGFAGGFAVSNLTSRKYAAVKDTSTTAAMPDSAYYIQRTKSGEDDVALGLAGFTHVCYNQTTSHSAMQGQVTNFLAWISPCASLGLGLSNTNSDLEFYPGLSYRLGNKFYITLGDHFGRVATLPNGLKVGDKVTSPNDLANLDKKYRNNVFVSFSYEFLGVNTPATWSQNFPPPVTK